MVIAAWVYHNLALVDQASDDSSGSDGEGCEGALPPTGAGINGVFVWLSLGLLICGWVLIVRERRLRRSRTTD